MARDTRHQRDRQEHGDDRRRRCKHGESDLVGGIERGLIARLAHAHVPDDVLDLNNRVIDKDARDQAHRHRRHEVERDAQHAHEPEGGDCGHWDSEGGNDRGANVAKKEEDHENGEDCAFPQALHRGRILAFGVIDRVEDFREADFRILLLELANFGPARLVGGDFGRALGALDSESDDLAAVHLGDRTLLRRGVPHFTQIGETDEAASRQGNLRLRKLVGVAGVAEHADRLFGAGDFGAAARGVHVALAKLLVDLRGGNALRLQRGRIEDHTDSAVDTA